MERAALLDVDGTLLDSNDAHARAWVDALGEVGIAVERERVRPLIGMGGDKLMPEVADLDPESEEGKRISARRSEIFRDRYLPKLQALPGARALLERLRADGFRLVVATSAKREELDGLLKAAGVADLVDAATTSDDAEASKPDPDIVVAALGKAGVPPHRAFMLGDTPYDVEAATKASVGIVALRSGGWKDQDLRGALAVYDTPADLLASYEKSPFSMLADT